MTVKLNAVVVGVLASFLTGLTSCGGGGGGDNVSAPHASGSQSVAAKTSTLAAGSSCEYGGIRVDTGVDVNNNGMLDSSEVTGSQNVCNGTPGLNSLLSLTQEPAGTNCSTGGVGISSGLDTNRNNTLDGSEITAIMYVCNDGSGGSGTPAPAGTQTISASTPTGIASTGVDTFKLIAAASSGYSATISNGFKYEQDKISYPAASQRPNAGSSSINNVSDGQVDLTWISNGNEVTIHLTNLDPTSEAALQSSAPDAAAKIYTTY